MEDEAKDREIKNAETDGEIMACYLVVRRLRDLGFADAFLERVRAQEASGFRLAYVSVDGSPVAAAGYRIGENLAWGRHLYVDDLITLPEARSQGHGSALLQWLVDMGQSEGCAQLHLDSATWRADDHRFYLREGLQGESFTSRGCFSRLEFDRRLAYVGTACRATIVA